MYKNYLSRGFSALTSLFLEKHYAYYIEEIDATAQRVILRCRGSHIIVRVGYTELIGDPHLLRGLPPLQACKLGGVLWPNVKSGNGGW